VAIVGSPGQSGLVVGGQPGADVNVVDAGSVLLLPLSRGTDGAPVAGTSQAIVRNEIAQTPSGTGLGTAVATVPDLDGDGVFDLAIGGNALGDAGLPVGVVVYSGADLLTDFAANAFVQPLRRWAPPAAASATTFGAAIFRVGDIDGDGLVDVALGDPDAERVWLVKSSDSWNAPSIELHPTADGVTGQPGTPTGLGWSVAPLRDVDDDGRDELVIGAPFYARAGATNVAACDTLDRAPANYSGDCRGAVVVIRSSEITAALAASAAPVEAGCVVAGTSAQSRFGFALRSLGTRVAAGAPGGAQLAGNVTLFDLRGAGTCGFNPEVLARGGDIAPANGDEFGAAFGQ
jgi:hypothetical protein